MQSSQVRNVGLPSCADTKRDVPAWTQDPKIFPLDWFSISRPNIIRQTKEYVSELSKWRNCPKIKTLSKLKAVLKRIMMFLHTHISYIDGKSLLECDLEEDLITLVSLYMDMELRVILIKKSATSGATTSNGPGTDTDSARNDKLVSDRISYWLYTVLTGHEQRVDALLSTTVYTRHTRPVLDPIFRKVLSEMPDGPFSNVGYVRNMLAYKTWRERTLVTDDIVSEELSARILQQLVPRDYAFPSPLLRCLGKGENARDHAQPHNVNLADACRNFMRYCREIPATAAEQINFESIPLLDDEMLGDEENEVNNLMHMISNRKQRKTASASPRNSIQVDAFIDLTLPISKTKSSSSRTNSSSIAAVIDLTEEDEKPVITAPTSVVVEPSAASSRVVSTVQRINASKKPQVTQECSYALTPSATQVETRCFTAYRDQDIYLVNISCMCPVRAHRQRECQCQDKKGDYYKENKALKASKTERKYEKDATFVGRCFQFSIGNQYGYPSEDDVDTEIDPLVVGNSQDQMKLEMRSSTAVTCNTNEDTTQDETTQFCDKLFSANLNLCDCDGCKNQDTNLSRYENRTCASDKTSHESANELSDNVQCRRKPLVTCTQRVPHPTSVADMYAMEKASPIVLQSQQTTTLSGNESNLEHFSETLDKRKVHDNDIQNTKIPKDNFVQNTENLSSNCLNEIQKIKLPVVDMTIEDTPDKFEPPVVNEDVYAIRINPITPTNTYEETVEYSKESFSAVIPINTYETCGKLVIPHISEETAISTVSTPEETTECRKIEISHSINDISTNTFEKSMECEKVVIPHFSEENIYEDRTEREKDIVSHCNEDTNNTISSNNNEETTKALHCNEDISNCTMLSNTEEITKCREDVTLNINEENASHTILPNTYEESSEHEKVVLLHSNEKNSNVVSSNTDEELAVSSHLNKEDFTQSTNISTVLSNENIEAQNALVTDIEVRSESTNITAETTSFDTSTLQEQISFLSNAQNEPLLSKSNSEIEIERFCNEVTELGCSITPDIDQPVENDSKEECSQNYLMEEKSSVSEPTKTTTDNLEKHSEEISEQPEETDPDVSTQNIETTVEEIVEHNELCVHPIQININSTEFENIVKTSITTEESSAKEELPNFLEIENVLPDDTNIVNPVDDKCVQQSTPETEIVVESVPEIRDISIQSSNDNQLENAESNSSNTELLVDETATITRDSHEDVLQTVIESESVVESVPEIHEITTQPSNDNQLENVESNGSNTKLPFDETVTITQDLHEDVAQTVIVSETVVESVPEIHIIAIQPSNDSKLENVESNGSNTELTFDETATMVQNLHEDVPQTVIESEIVVESVPEICDITIQPSNDNQLENVESNGSNTELSFDETATITQDLHEDVPQTVTQFEIVVESVPEIHEITIQPSNDIQFENVESNDSNTDLTLDETATIKQDLHEDEPQTVIESEIVVESVSEIRDITIQSSNDSQLENVESYGSNTELSFDETATKTQDLHENVPQTVIESEIVVESVPEIHEITIQPSNDIQFENVESNDSNTDLTLDETATIKQDLHEDEPQTVIESEIVVESVSEIRDITIQSSNDSQLENVESYGSNTELSFDETATKIQDLHENVPQTVIESEIVVQSVPEIHEITIQPFNDSQLENVESNVSNTELSFDETATIKQDFHEVVPQTVIESEIVVQSVPEICDIAVQPSNDSQLENVESNGSNTELSFHETASITQDLHEDVPQTVNITSSDHVEPKEKSSFVIQTNETVVISKNDEEIILSPRKRRRRKPNLNMNKLIDEVKPAEPCDEILVTIDSLNGNVSVNIEERKSLNDCESADNSPEQPKSIKSSTKKFEETQDMSTTCQEISSGNTNLSILSKEIVSYDTKPIDPTIEDTVSVQTSKSERPKRRRKQNLKNIREEKLTATVEDNLIPQNLNKKLVVVCKNLSQNEIDTLRINKSQPLLENITEERDAANIHLNVTNQFSKDISTPNLNIVEASLQPVIVNGIKNKTDLNIENNNANIEHPEDTLQTNNKEKPKQRTTKIKSTRKSKLVDNISDKIENNVVDRVTNSTLVETLPITKLKRPRGRPSTKASRKLKFFSENLNLHNLNSTKNNSNSDIVTSSNKLNTTAQLDLSDEDVPLAYRISQSTPQKINSLKSSNKIINKLRLSDVENELVKSEDELPLSARKQKTKPTKHPKNNSTTKAITKPKTFREKLQKFKFQARDKTEIIDNIKIQEEESDIFTLKKFNTESKPRKAVRTYSNTRALKTPKLFSVPEIIQASTIKPSKSILVTSPVKPKKSLRFASEVTMISYNEEDILNPEAARNINESKNSNIEESKNLNSSLHRAEQIKINKFREISDTTDLLSFENPKISNKKDNVSPAEIHAITTQENKNIEISTDLKSSTNNKEIKTNLVLASKKMLSKKAREKLFPETNENYKENKSKIIMNNKKVEEASFPENSSSLEEKNNALLPKSSSSEYKENESSIKIRKNNEHEIVNIDQKENSPTKFKSDTPISSKDTEQDSEIIPKNVPKKRRSKFPKLKLKGSSCSPKKLQNNIDSPPKKVTQFKKKNKIQVRLNGSNKSKKVTSRRKSNKTESNVNVLQQDVTLNLKCDTKDITPDSIKDSVIDTAIKKEENQNVEITKNISSSSSENESAELTNICAEKVEDKTDIPENIESANISSDMLYKPSNKIYEKDFEIYSDQDDVSNSELVIDTSAESSDAEDTKVENKLEIDEINQQIQNKVSDLNQIKYHHSIAEIINITPVENSTTENKSHVSTQDYINTELEESPNEPQKENNSVDEKFDPSVISVSEETVTQESNSKEKNDVILNPSEEMIENNTFQESLLSQETSVKHQETNIINNVYDSSSISIVEETVVEDMIVDESLITNEDQNNTVFDKNIDTQNTVEEKPTKIIIEELSAEILEISEEMCNELCIEKVSEEKAQQLIEPYAPSVEMLMNIEIGFESCTISQDKPVQEEHAKEGCVKCSVNGKHKDNKRVKVQGTHQYEENNVEEYLEEHEIIPAITYCQAVEISVPNLCICTAKDVTAQILTHNSPVVDNYNLCILADLAIHLNTKTENNNVIQISGEGSNNIQSQGPLQKDERCVFVTFPDNAPTSSKPTIAISVIDSNNEEMSVNVQKIADGVNSKGNLLENKIQVLTERARNGNKINGENLDELYRSLENICELEINTITKTSPKSDCHAAAPIPIETPPVHPKIIEPNITIDIPNTALLHLTPDDDDFPIRNEPFGLQMPVVQSLETPAVPQIEKAKIDTAIVKNLYNELESIIIDQKTPISENENCESPKEAEQATKTKSKKGRSKSKTSNNQKSEASYLLNKYKSNQDSNTNTNNQQNSNSRKNNNSSPTSYIRSTRPMRMVTTRKRNVNVLDNNCSPDEPAKKISASEKMFDKLLEEHRKELSVSKLQYTKEETVVEKNVENVQKVSDTTMPVLDDIPETPVISAPIINTEESNIPLPVLNYEKQESNLKNEEIETTKSDTSNDIAEKIELVTSINDHEDDGREKLSEEKMVEEIALEIPSDSEKDLVHKKTQSEDNELSQPAEITTACTETQIEKNTEEQIGEEEVDRNASAIEVVQDWFNRVDENKSQSESYTDITSIQTIEECNFFEEEVSSTSENSPNARKSDEKVFSEHQTPDSGIAFDEDSVQKDKSVPSDGETYCPTEPAVTKTYFCNLNQSDGVKQIEISDIKLVKPSKSSEINEMELKVSIELERIKDILPLLTKYTPERKIKKRKELITETDKTKKRKYNLDETRVNIVSEDTSNNPLLKDCKFKRRKHSNDDNILQECVIEDVMSPATSQRDMSNSIRTKGSVKEYPDLFGITESPVPSGSFHSPYPSDISITEEPTFSEECGIDLCNDYPCYDSFEVLQEQQSSQREYSVVDDNPKDVQQGIQAGYCVLDLQCLPISEYMNDGDYILVDNKIVNDKRMVLVNMQQVQPETKPHNPEEVKRSEFDDSEKEDSLSETVEEIIKNPSLFSEQTASEFQVISMDQATSEVQVVIACDNFQETEMTDNNYLFGIALQNELTSSETPSTSAASDIQPTPMELEETTPDNKVIEKSVELPTPEKDEQLNNISAVSQPVSMELLTAVNSIPKPVGAQPIENNEEIKPISKDKLTNTYDLNESGEKSRKMSARKLSIEEQSQHFYTSRSPTSKLTTQAPSIENSYKTFQKSCYLKPSTQYKQGISDAKEVNKSREELATKTYSLKTPDKNLPAPIKSPFKDQPKYDHQYGARINSNNTYPDHKSHASTQKPLKTDPITSHSVSPANKKLNDSKVPSKQYSPKTYRSKVSPDAFDRLKQDQTDITPPNSRTRYHSSTTDPNFMKNRYRKETALDYHRRHSLDRRSPRLKQISQSSSDSRRPQSAYTEPSPKPSYRLPPSDPTHRSSQYNNKKPDAKTSQSRMESKHSQSASSAHKDWLKNETLLNLIKTANNIYSKKY